MIEFAKGKYPCIIRQQGFTTSKNGTPQFVLKFDVLTDKGPVTRYYFKTLTEKTMDYFVADMKNLGFAGSSMQQLDPAHPNHVSFVEREVEMYCGHSTDQNGDPKEEWGVALPAMEMKPPPATALRSLDLLFGAAMKKTGGSRVVSAPKPKPQPVPVAAGDVPSDDDVPW